MKKGLISMLSVLFLFSLVFFAIVLLGAFLQAEILWALLVLWGIGLVWSIVVAAGKRRRADVKLRWVMFLIFVPIIGLFSYIFFGREYHLSVDKDYRYLQFKDLDENEQDKNNQISTKILSEHLPQYANAFKVGGSIQHDLIFRNSQMELINNASEAWIKIFRDLELAQNYILINFYIVDDGELFRNLKKTLIRKAQQGVRVYFIYDFVGSFTKLSLTEQKELKDAGVLLHSYMPMVMPFLNWKSNYRDHRKDISIDGKIGYIGGSNIADEYINKSTKFGYWNDEQVRVIGSAVQGIEKIFASDWKFVTKNDLLNLEPSVGAIHSTIHTEEESLFQIVASGPNHDTYAHYEIIMKLIAESKNRIWLSSPYFVPPTEMIEQLRIAALSGVDVRLVLPGLTDKKMLLDVSERYADKLFDAGVKIYSMNKTFNHTKAYLFDDEISFLGSTNLDYRAFFADQQTMGLIYSKNFNKKLEERFENEFNLSKLNTISPYRAKNWFRRFSTVLLGWASPLL